MFFMADRYRFMATVSRSEIGFTLMITVAIDSVIAKGVVGDTYNVGNNEWANIDVVNLLCATLDSQFSKIVVLPGAFRVTMRSGVISSLIEFVSDRPGHDSRYAINADKIKAELGFEPIDSFESRLARTIDWYLNNESWWKAVQSD